MSLLISIIFVSVRVLFVLCYEILLASKVFIACSMRGSFWNSSSIDVSGVVSAPLGFSGWAAGFVGGGDRTGAAGSVLPSSAWSMYLSSPPAMSFVFFSEGFSGGAGAVSGVGEGCSAGVSVAVAAAGVAVLAGAGSLAWGGVLAWSLRSWTPARAVMTSLMRASLSDWMALMTPISMWRRLLVAHFIWLSVWAKISTRLSRRSVWMGSTDVLSLSQNSCGMPSLSAVGSTLETSSARRQPMRSSRSWPSSLPESACWCRISRAATVSLVRMLSVSLATVSREVKPKISRTFSSVM